jgi:anti-sigma B factor antagonist
MSEPGAAKYVTISIEQGSGFAVVRCRGRLVAGSGGPFYDEVRELIPSSERIVLDLGELTQLDSMGLAALVRLYVSAKAAGSRLELVNVGGRIRQILGVTHLISVFTIIGEGGVRIL